MNDRTMSQARRICNNAQGNMLYRVKDMLFDTREAFDHFKCSQYGCLQIAEFNRRPDSVNWERKSDQALFYLPRADA